jgi:hypothetical protein
MTYSLKNLMIFGWRNDVFSKESNDFWLKK